MPTAQRLKQILKKTGPYLLVLVVICSYYGPALFSEETFNDSQSNSDVRDTFEPLTIFQYREFQNQGSIPDWVDQAGFGYPLSSGGYSATYYPPRFFALAVAGSAQSAADIYIFIHVVLGAFLMMALARFYGLSPWATATVAVTYSLAHLIVRWMPLFHTPVFFAFFPAAILGLELIWKRRPFLGIPLMGLSLGCLGLGGYLQAFHMTVQLLLLICLYRAITSDYPWKTRLKTLAISASGFVFAILISAPTWLPFFLEQTRSARQELTLAMISRLDLDSLLTVISPSLSTPNTERYFDPVISNYAINSDLYLGIFVVPFLILGFAKSIKSRQLGYLPITGVLILLIAVKGPLFEAISIIPGWDRISTLERLSFILVPIFCLLVGLGFDDLKSRFGARKALLVSGLALPLLAIYWQLDMNTIASSAEKAAGVHIGTGNLLWISLLAACVAVAAAVFWKTKNNGAFTAILAVGLALVLTSAALTERNYGWKPESTRFTTENGEWLDAVSKNNGPLTRWMTYCVSGFNPNRMLATDASFADLYESFINKDTKTYLTRMFGFPAQGNTSSVATPLAHTLETTSIPNGTLVNTAGVSLILSDNNEKCVRQAKKIGWKPVESYGQKMVYRNDQAFPLAYLSHRWATTGENPAQIINDIAHAKDYSFVAHTDFISEPHKQIPGSADEPPTQVASLSRTNDEVTITLPPMEQKSLLVLLDTYHPDWKTYVDGKNTPTRRVNGAFRGVELPSHAKQVVMKYQPSWRPALPIIAWIVSLALLAWMLIYGILWAKSK